MPVELKNALTAWKRAKPVTTTKTGVSEALRPLVSLVEKGTPKTIPEAEKLIVALTATKKALDTAASNKTIKSEKRALDCLQEILKSIGTEYNKQSEFIKGNKQAARHRIEEVLERNKKEKADAEKLLQAANVQIKGYSKKIKEDHDKFAKFEDKMYKEKQEAARNDENLRKLKAKHVQDQKLDVEKLKEWETNKKHYDDIISETTAEIKRWEQALEKLK